MLSALVEIFRDRWEWRSRIVRLAMAEIRSQGRGAALSWGWFLIRPIAYIACFWFAIGLGLRAGTTGPGEPPYILWLSSGIIPWMFMRDSLNKGSRVFRMQSAMVTTMRIPLGCITSIYTVSFILIQAVLVVLLLLMSLIYGMDLDVYLLQIPILLALMVFFWDTNSLLLSILGAISKDIENLVQVFSTPLFWISGIIFNMDRFPVEWVKPFFNLNPISFFAKGYRVTFCDKTWLFCETDACLGFLLACVAMLIVTGFLYKRFAKVIPDVV